LGRPPLVSFLERLVAAVVFFPHGAQKLLGWFGGPAFAATMEALTQKRGIPAVLAFLVIIAEFFGSLGLAVGFLTRLAAFGLGCVMVTAALLVHLPNGFFMNWTGTQKGEGFEFHVLALGILIALLWKGGGRASVDRMLTR
jgi:putative oxidoreductase